MDGHTGEKTKVEQVFLMNLKGNSTIQQVSPLHIQVNLHLERRAREVCVAQRILSESETDQMPGAKDGAKMSRIVCVLKCSPLILVCCRMLLLETVEMTRLKWRSLGGHDSLFRVVHTHL